MNWFAIILGILFFIVWTLLIGFIAERSGAEKERIRQSDTSDEPIPYTFSMEFDAEAFTHEFHAALDRLDLLGQQVQHIDEQQKAPPADVSMGAQRRLEMIEPLESRVTMLEETVSGFRDRFTRVERKAGMRV